MSDKKRKIIICAGGTGGHVFPAKKLSQLLLKEGVDVRWIGSSRGPEQKICKNLKMKVQKCENVLRIETEILRSARCEGLQIL